MLEITAAQTLIALPTVGRITAIGLASAVFTYYLVVSEPAFSSNPSLMSRWRVMPIENSPQTLPRPSSLLVSIALQVIAGVFLPAAARILEALLTAVIAVSVTTCGQ